MACKIMNSEQVNKSLRELKIHSLRIELNRTNTAQQTAGLQSAVLRTANRLLSGRVQPYTYGLRWRQGLERRVPVSSSSLGTGSLYLPGT